MGISDGSIGKDLKQIDFERAISNIMPDLKALGLAFEIPFAESLEIMKKDRALAVENYNRFKSMIDKGDDEDSTKDGLNNAMKMVIQSTQKLNKLVETAGKMIGDSMKSLAIAESKKFDQRNDTSYFKDIRANVIEGKATTDEEGEDSKE